MFGLYMQAREGNKTTDAPGGLSGKDERGDTTFWLAQSGKSQQDAAQEYVKLVTSLLKEKE